MVLHVVYIDDRNITKLVYGIQIEVVISFLCTLHILTESQQ